MTELLNRSAYLVLGMISTGYTTGYEISKWAEVASRFFWAAGDGHVYPQLKKLEQSGFVTFDTEEHGARTRKRYALTEAGRRELDAWLVSRHEPIVQLRDESLLQLFFSDGITVADLTDRLRMIRAIHVTFLDRLHEVEPAAREFPATLLTQQYGLAMHGAVVSWCDETLARVAELAPDELVRDALAAPSSARLDA